MSDTHNSIRLFDYHNKSISAIPRITKRLCECGFNYFNAHYYGIGCYDGVFVYFFGIDTPDHLDEAKKIVEEFGFDPVVCKEGECVERDPYEILFNQSITKKYSKDIKEETEYRRELREAERKYNEELDRIRAKRLRRNK